MDTLTGQIYAFALTIAAGLTLGVLFDLYRLWRRATHPRRTTTAISDILFWLIATPLTYVYLLMGNWAELRFYVILGLLLGLFLYFAVFSTLVVNMVTAVGYFLISLLGMIVQGVSLLLAAPWEVMARWHLQRHWRPHAGKTQRSIRWRQRLRWQAWYLPQNWWRLWQFRR